MQGFGKWKRLIQLWKQFDGSYTLMLVPHDGRSISKKDLHTKQMKKAVTWFGVVALGTAGVIVLLSSMLYVRNKEANELAAYRAIKAQQEQKLQELGIPILAEDTGLNYGRTVELNCANGDYVIKAVGKPIKTI